VAFGFHALTVPGMTTTAYSTPDDDALNELHDLAAIWEKDPHLTDWIHSLRAAHD
jgi:hypothetical protein